MPVFFISSSSIQGQFITLGDPLYTHLCKSLRVHIGQELLLRDEQRQQHRITIIEISKTFLTVEIQDTQSGPPQHNPTVTLAQSILKREQMAWSIQKSTELGVTNIIPIITERTQSRFGSHSLNHYRERWERIALEAAQQSERWNVPHILAPQNFKNFLKNISSKDRTYLLTERKGLGSGLPVSGEQLLDTESNVVLAVGPEGGWSQEEIQEAEKASFQQITLGEKVLRSETAAMVGLAILQERLKQLTFTITA